MASKEEPWGQLVSTTELESDPVMMNKCEFSIGRAPGLLSQNSFKIHVSLPASPPRSIKIVVPITTEYKLTKLPGLGRHGRELGRHGRELGRHGRELGRHRRGLGRHGRERGWHGQELGRHGRELGRHGRQLGRHGQELGRHGRQLGRHGRELGRHRQELGRH